jgi:Mor family transcriptional regulator
VKRSGFGPRKSVLRRGVLQRGAAQTRASAEPTIKQKTTIRQLKPGEPLPPGPPKRYKAGHGYIRLRWKIAPRQYVETYEHRLDGDHVTTAEHVHHKNRRRDDNRPDNLKPLSAAEHAEHHTEEYHRRAHRMAKLYEEGWSTVELSRKFRISTTCVYRRLVDVGVTMRSAEERRAEVPPEQAAEMYMAGRSITSLARQYRMDSGRITKLIRAGGGVIRKPGRPKAHPVQTENAVRLIVRERSGGRCEVCGFAKATNFQHRKAVAHGGPWDAANGLDVCGHGNLTGCHGRIHQCPTEAYENGWSVRSGHSYSATPVRLAVHGLAYLDSTGGVRPVDEAAA